jgi:hypothetical protein
VTRLSPFADNPGNGQITYFYTSWNLPFSKMLSFSPLVVKKITPTIQTDVEEGLNMRDMENASTETIRQERLDTRHKKHWLLEEKRIGAAHVLLQTKEQQ